MFRTQSRSGISQASSGICIRKGRKPDMVSHRTDVATAAQSRETRASLGRVCHPAPERQIKKRSSGMEKTRDRADSVSVDMAAHDGRDEGNNACDRDMTRAGDMNGVIGGENTEQVGRECRRRLGT